MKNIIIIIISALVFCMLAVACKSGLEKEARRQCIVAQDMCSKYDGACKDVEFYCGK